MESGAKPGKTKVDTKPPVPRKSRKIDGSSGRQLEQRLAEALEQQAATSEILSVISSSPTDVQPVLEAVAEWAARLCKAPFARVLFVDGDVLRPMSHYSVGGQPQALADPVPLQRTSITGRAALDRATIHHADIVPLLDAEFPDARENAQREGFHAVLAVPLMRDGSAYGAIFLYRREAGLFSPEQVEVVQTFTRQVAIAVDNVRLFKQTKEALEQQTATSEILRVISRSQTNVQPVFDTIVAAAMKLCSGSSANVFTFDGKLIHLAALVNLNPEGAAAIRRLWPRPPGRDLAAARAILTCRAAAIPDVLEDRDFPASAANAAVVGGGFRSVLAVPLMREGSPIGAIAVGRPQPGPFADEQIALLETFADQAVIAIENVRLFNETKEALEQQTATSEILRVISQSQTDVQPVFDSIAAAALELCGANSANVFTIDGELILLAARVSSNPAGDEAVRRAYPRPLDRNIAIGRAILTRNVASIPDVLEDPGYGMRETALAVGFRSILAVPLLRDGEPIGAISASRPEPGPFPEKQIALLKSFAAQAVIAIENVRLFTQLGARNRDLTEALKQQTATSEILRVISRSQTDVQPVFDTIAKAALELCRAKSANVFTYDGELVHLASFENENPKYVEVLRQFFPRPPSRDTAVLRAILTRTVVAIPDVLDDKEYRLGAHAPAGGFRSALAVPLIREGSAIGGIAVGRAEPGPFPDVQIALLQTFADQAVIAIENVRLFKELEARTTELTRSVDELKALGEVGQAVSSTLELEIVLSTIVSRAAQLAGMDGGSIWEYDERREQFSLHATDRLPDELVEVLRATPIKKGEGALGRLAVTSEPVAIRDIVDERNYQSRVREILIRCGYRSVLAVPLLREDHLLGALAVNRRSPGEFAPEVIDLLKTFATQSALAIQNARLFREIEDKGRQLETASRHKSEFLANMSHELRTPLNAIIGFSEVLSERMFGEINDKQAEYLADILESGRHLLSLINDILDLSKIEAGRMELEPTDFDLPSVIENTLILVRERAHRRGITLGHAIDADLREIRADERKVKQVLLNLLSNALKFTPEGGRIDVRARRQESALEVSVADTGVGIAPEDQEAVFEEFRQVGTAAKKVEGTGLGLAISRKFIELHGGRIWVKSQVGSGSTFAFSLPLPIDPPRQIS